MPDVRHMEESNRKCGIFVYGLIDVNMASMHSVLVMGFSEAIIESE